MHTNLVSAAGLKSAADVRVPVIAGQDFPVGNGLSSVFLIDRHAFSVCRVASDRTIDRSAFLTQTSPDDSLVYPRQTVVGKL